MSKSVCVVDLSSIFFNAWHATVNAAVSEARSITLSGVRRAAEGHDYVAICTDEGRSWRKNESPSYKAQRPEKDPQSLHELKLTKERLEQDGYCLFGVDGFEADDVIGTCVAHARKDGLLVTIASADKDLLQLVGDGVVQLSTRTWQVMRADDVAVKFGVPPNKMRDYLAMVGDASDNISGIPGVGPKRAVQLLEQFGSLHAFMAQVIERDDVVTPAITKAAREKRAEIELSWKLVGLVEAPIDWERIYAERKPQKLQQDWQEDERIDMSEDEAAELISQNGAEEKPAEPEPAKAEVVDAQPEKKEAERAMVVRPAQSIAVPFERGLEPSTIQGALWLAKGLVESRLYQRFAGPEAIMAIIIRGRELGIGALTALDCFHVVEGKPYPNAHFIIAKAKEHPDCEYFQFVEGDDTKATWETKNRRNPQPTRFTYTIDQAKAAGRVAPSRKTGEPNQWMKMPAELLRKTSGVQLARIEYPDAALGLYSYEEMEMD